MGLIMPGDFRVVHIKQVFSFNCVCINEVPLYTLMIRNPPLPPSPSGLHFAAVHQDKVNHTGTVAEWGSSKAKLLYSVCVDGDLPSHGVTGGNGIA